MQDSLVTYIKGLTGVREVKESAQVANTQQNQNNSSGNISQQFIVEGIVIGLIGAAIPLGVLYFMYQKIIVYIAAKFNFIGSMIVFEPVKVVFRTLIPVGVILGAGIGFIGSQMTIRKHLKV